MFINMHVFKALYIYIFIPLIFLLSFGDVDFLLYIVCITPIIVILSFLMQRREISLTILDVIALLWMLYEVYSYNFSIYKDNSITFLKNVFLTSCLYIIIRINKSNSETLFYSVLGGLFICCINLVEILFFFIFVQGLSFYDLNDITQFRYLFMPFGIHSNEWVTNLLIMLIFPMYFLLKRKVAVSKNSIYGKMSIYLSVIAINLILFNIIISFSRGAYLALFIGGILCLILLLIKKMFSKIVLFSIILPILGVIIFIEPVKRTVLYNYTISHQRSSSGRIVLWKNALELYKTKPLNGIGTGNFPLVYNGSSNYNKENRPFTGRISNTYLQILVEKGCIGVVIYLILMLAISLYILKYMKMKQIERGSKYFIICSFWGIIVLLIRELTFSSFFFSKFLILSLGIILAILSNIISEVNIIRLKYSTLYMLIYIGVCSTFIVTIYRIDTANEYYIKFLELFDKNKFSSSLPYIQKACLIKKTNSYYQSCKILNLIRLSEAETKTFKISDVGRSLEMTKFELRAIINELNSIIKMNPYDNSNYHNIAWLYFYIGDYQNCFRNIQIAESIGKNISIPYISAGLMYLHCRDEGKVRESFEEAIICQPDFVDSRLWHDFTTQYIGLSEAIIKSVMNRLKCSSDPIEKAKLAKVLIYNKRYDEAYSILINVSNMLPNMSKSWHNLGYIYQVNQNYPKMIDCYNKAIFLDNNYMSYFNMGKYYDAINKSEAIISYKFAAHYLQKTCSEYSIINRKIYSVETVKNNLIPKSLMDYSIPLCVSPR